jgi:tRNA threonylcarbamoyladenosine biosynthesis protein TsaE
MVMQEACRFVSKNEEETRRLGVRLAELLEPGDVLALVGDLGAGKTTFAQGIAKGLGVEEAVDSPTFTIIKEYRGRLPFYHMDVYRLESPDEDLGWDEFFFGDGVTLVEWADRIKELLPDHTVCIALTVGETGDRLITFAPDVERVRRLCRELRRE